MMNREAWTVNVPINDLLALLGAMDDLEKVSSENKQLRREVDGLRRVQSEILQVLGDLRRSLKFCQPQG